MIDCRKIRYKYLFVSLIAFFLILIFDYRLLVGYLFFFSIISIIIMIIYVIVLYLFKILRNQTDFYIDRIIIPEYEEYKKKSETEELDGVIQIVWRL